MARLTKEDSRNYAESLFKEFTGHEPCEQVIVEVDELPHSAAVIGRLHGLIYDTIRDGEQERYIHRFKDECAPILAISDTGDQILIVGGNYEFTERGIEDN